MSEIKKSWNFISDKIAESYLKSYGNPALGSKELLVDILKELSKGQRIKLLDLGCGNGHLYECFKESNLKFCYAGVDFSEPLIAVAKNNNPNIDFHISDLSDLSSLFKDINYFDVAIFSHVIEMLESPEAILEEAKKYSKSILIRFFEPPEKRFDMVELRLMNLGSGDIPYLRRKISWGYYQLILSNLGVSQVKIYKDIGSKDQVHHLLF